MGIFGRSKNRCLWCGLFAGETELLPGFASWLCVRCAPKEPSKLEQALREFVPLHEAGKELFREIFAKIQAHFGEEEPILPPYASGGCANCGTTGESAPIRINFETMIGWCVRCLLAGLGHSPGIHPTALAATASENETALDRLRLTELATRRAEKRPFDARAYAEAVKLANENSETSLILDGKLWDLVRRCKLRPEPKIPPTGEELCAGFSSNHYLQGDEEKLNQGRLSALKEMLPYLEALSPESSEFEKSQLLGWVVVFAHALRKHLDDDTRIRTLKLLDSWKPQQSYGQDSIWETVTQKATNHYLVRESEVSYVRRLLVNRGVAAKSPPIEYLRSAEIDGVQFVELCQRAGYQPVPSTESATLMLKHTSIVLLAKSEGKVVGALRAMTDFVSVCMICDVLVDAQFQGAGVGSRLVVELQKTIANKCPVSVVSKVEPTFFSHLGFAPVAGLQRS